MADVDRFIRDVAAGVVPPEFDDLVRVSRRRRRRIVVGAAAASLVLIGVAAYGAAGVSGDEADPTVPASTPTLSPDSTAPTPSDDIVPTAQQQMTAEEILLDPSSYLAAFAASATDPDLRASVWRCQEQPRCKGWRGAITVTDNGFRTSHPIDLPRNTDPTVTDVGAGAFLVGAAPRGLLVHGDGTTVDLVAVDTPGPLAPAEVLVPYWRGVGTQAFGGLDPSTGRVHPLTLPAGSNLDLQQSGEVLFGTVDTPGAQEQVVWSDDGGATWHESATLPDFPSALSMSIPSMQTGVMAWLVGRDGATLFPLDEVLRSTDGGATFETTLMARTDARAYVSFGLVLPDGRLLVNLDAWSDDTSGEPGEHHRGLYLSNGDAWGSLTPVESRYPEGTDLEALQASPLQIMDWAAGPSGEVVLWGWSPEINTPMMVSSDSGETWEESAAR